MGETSILVGMPLGKRLFGSQMEDNIKMDLKNTSCMDARWMELAQDGVQWRYWAIGCYYHSVGSYIHYCRWWDLMVSRIAGIFTT